MPTSFQALVEARLQEDLAGAIRSAAPTLVKGAKAVGQAYGKYKKFSSAHPHLASAAKGAVGGAAAGALSHVVTRASGDKDSSSLGHRVAAGAVGGAIGGGASSAWKGGGKKPAGFKFESFQAHVESQLQELG